jgi:hypothetical protein
LLIAFSLNFFVLILNWSKKLGFSPTIFFF